VVLVWSNPKQVGLGGLGALAAGIILWFLIPPSRRGKVPGITDGVADVEPLTSGARITI
jgi:hypothetical protein